MGTAIQITDAFITFTIWSSIGFFSAAFIYHAMFGFESNSQPTVSGDTEAWVEVEANTEALMLGADDDIADIDELLSINAEPRKPNYRWGNIRQLKAMASLYRMPKYNRLKKA